MRDITGYLGRGEGQVALPVESRADIRTHGFWNQGITVMFDIRIINLNTGYYLLMMSEKAFSKAEKDKKDLYLQACLERICYLTPMV